MKSEIPHTSQKFREAIYDGNIYLLPASAPTTRLASLAKTMITNALGPDYRTKSISFEDVGRVRKEIFSNTDVHELVVRIIQALDLDRSDYVFEPPKLRVVSSDGHLIPAAAPVYFGHRDTWYATSQSTINFWIPISDLAEEETFVFYPDVFSKRIPNNSGDFSFEADQLKVGWENKTDGLEKKYPSLEGDFDPGKPLGFSPDFASLLIFSGSHYHQTLKQSKGTSRFSLDFRLVHIEDDKNNFGAPNVDNESQGSCVSTYLKM